LQRAFHMLPTLQSTISRNSEIVTKEIDGDMVMMSITEGSVFGLNVVGLAIWDLLETPTSVEIIIAHVLDCNRTKTC